jgi:sialate O-acetylesterase
MINPYLQGPMTLKGFIWYQGESNVGQASYYQCAFPTMISDWRKSFGNPSLWFGFVQIAGIANASLHPTQSTLDNPHNSSIAINVCPGYNYGTDQTPAYLREAQLAALQLPNVALASAVDVGLALDIHPTGMCDIDALRPSDTEALLH